MSYPWPVPTGYAPSTVTNPISATVVPPQYIQNELSRIGTPWDATKYGWDPMSMSLIDKASGNRYSYANIADHSLGTNVVLPYGYSGGDLGYGGGGTNLGVTLPGFGDTLHFDEGQNPYIAFPGGRDEIFVSGDPSAIDAYQHDAQTRALQGVATVGALVGGGAALSGAGAGTTTGTGTATVTAPPIVSAGSVAPDVGALISGGMGPQAVIAGGGSAAGAAAGGAAAGVGGAIMNNLPSIISGASSLIGGVMASNAAEDATDATLQANREALDYQRESRDIALGLMEPERQSANAAMARMLQMQGLPIPASLQAALDESGVTLDEFDVSQTPGYQFRLKEAMDALETSAFARGGGMAGGFAEHALRYAQDYASNEYANIYSQLGVLAGRNTSTGGANAALSFGGNAAAITQDSGAARASGYVAQSNAWQNALDQVAQLPWDQWFGRNRSQPTALARGGAWG